MAQVTLQVKVERKEIDKLQQDIDKLNKTTINIKTSQTTKDITATETATRQLLRTEKERQRLEQETQKTAQQTAKAERDRQNAITATNKAEQSKINLERAAAKQAQETARSEQQAAKAEKEADKAAQEHNKNLKQQGLLYDILGRSLSSFIARMTMYRAVYAGIRAITNGMTEALQTMKQVDDQLVSVRKVTGFDDATLKRIEQNAYKTASQYGTTAPEYMESVVRFSQAGYKELSSDLAELSTKAQIVGDMTGEVADQFLLSVDAAYKYGGSVTELSKVLDGLNEIENKNATSIEKMAEGMGIVAPVAAQMHVSVEELAASLGVITAVTQRSGTEAARALRAIYLNIVGDTKTEIEEGVTWTTGEIEGLRDVIKLYAKDAWDAAQASGGIIDPMKAIAGLAKSVKDGVLSEAELMEMVSDIGGKLRTSQLLALINNWDMYETMLAQYKDAFGSADKEVENAMDSWTRKTNVLKNTWTEFVQKSLNSNLFKKAIDSLTWIIKGLGSLENSLKIIAGFYLAAKINKLLTGIKLVSGAIETMGGGFKNTIKVLLSYRSSMHAAEVEGKSLEAQTLANDAANKSLAMSFSWVTAAIAVLTIAYTAYTVASNKVEDAHEKEIEAIYKAGDEAKSASENIMQLYTEFYSAADGSDTLTESAKRLAEALGYDIPEGVKNATASLRSLTRERLQDYLSDQYEAVHTAEKEYINVANYGALRNNNINIYRSQFDGYNSGNQILDWMWGRFYSDKRFFKPDAYGMEGDVLDFNSENLSDLLAFRDVLTEIVDKTQTLAREENRPELLDSTIYKMATQYLNDTADALDNLNTETADYEAAEARIKLLDLLATTTIDSKESFDAFTESIKNSDEYTEKEKDALIELA